MKNNPVQNMARDFVSSHDTKSKIFLAGSILGFGFIVASPAQAAIINYADVNGLRTFQDVGTGLVWADLDNFSNKTTAQMKASVEAAGFTFANKSSVQTLLDGIPLTGSTTVWDSYATVMGRSSTRNLIWGSYDDGGVTTSVGYAYSFSGNTQWNLLDAAISDTASFSDMGIFAYKSASAAAVPEPFTIIGTLIGGTAAVRMRKKLKSADKG
jgi:hypothetical protein